MAPIIIKATLEGGYQNEDIRSLVENLRSHDGFSIASSVIQGQSIDLSCPHIVVMLNERDRIMELVSLLVRWVRIRPTTAVQLTVSRKGGRSASIETFFVRPLPDAGCAELVERISRILNESTVRRASWILFGLGLILAFAVAGWLIFSDLSKDKNSPMLSQRTTALPPAAPSATTDPVVLHLYNVQFNQVPGGDSLRIEVHAAVGEVNIEVKFSPTARNGAMRACSTPDLDAHADMSNCVTFRSGEPTNIGDGAKPRAIEIKSTDLMPVDVMGQVEELRISYRAENHAVSLRLPSILPRPGLSACKDNGCNPFIELTPYHVGPFSATATWSGTGNGVLMMQEGGLVAHHASLYGIPYRTVAIDEASGTKNSPRLQIAGRLNDAEAGIVVVNTDTYIEGEESHSLISPRLDIMWP